MSASQGPQHSSQQSMYVKTVTAQHHLQHGKSGHTNEMAKYASGRIPFADAPNPAGPPSQGGHQQHKTPNRPAQVQAKSSPHYPPSESIALPDIATDSEDEDSDNEFQAPNWVNSPALRELLSQQQLVDPEAIFGPSLHCRWKKCLKTARIKSRSSGTGPAVQTGRVRIV